MATFYKLTNNSVLQLQTGSLHVYKRDFDVSAALMALKF